VGRHVSMTRSTRAAITEEHKRRTTDNTDLGRIITDNL